MLSVLLQIAFLFSFAGATKLLAKRQDGQNGAFVPEVSTTVAVCADLGPNYLVCGTVNCYDPSIGDTCCADECMSR